MDDRSWQNLEGCLQNYVKETFPYCVEEYSGFNMTALGNPTALQKWAQAGINVSPPSAGAWNSVLANFEKEGIGKEPQWFTENPNHPLTKIRDFCKKHLDKTTGQGNPCSIRKLYIDLQRPPYGLQCVPFSAFVLGFVLREWLKSTRQLQWTDGKLSKKLDVDSLSEIIETVVKDDGNGAIKNEKLICRLSKEEKAFVEQAPTMFGYSKVPNTTVESTLQSIGDRLDKVASRIPLWTLSDYIGAQDDPCTEDLTSIIDHVCCAMRISASGDTDKRTNAIKEIGALLLSRAGLAEAFARYIKPECFSHAFKKFVVQHKPELCELAQSIGDVSDKYCEILRKQLAETAGWLWDEKNVEDELELVYIQYKIVAELQSIFGNTSYVTYDEAKARVAKAISEENKISLDTISKKYPFIDRFKTRIMTEKEKLTEHADELYQIVKQHGEVLKTLFFDPFRTELLTLLRSEFSEQLSSLSQAELRVLYDSLGRYANYSDEEFKKAVAVEINTFLQKSVAKQMQTRWESMTHSHTPDEWSHQHVVPAQILFTDTNLARNVIDALSNPADFTTEKLLEVQKGFEEIGLRGSESEISLKQRFCEQVVPANYLKSGIDADEMCKYLSMHLNNDPNQWLSDPNSLRKAIECYIQNHYETMCKTNAMATIRNMSETEAKNLLMEVIDAIPDAGMFVLEKKQ